MIRNNLFDLLKGICCIFVIINHTGFTNEEALKYLFPFWVWMAVPIFMIISGYLCANSFEKKNVTSIAKAYNVKYISNKIIRYTIPFTIAYVIEIIAYSFFNEGFSLGQIVWYFFMGGNPSIYYYPLMIQFIFVFPIIYFLIKKYNLVGLIICVGANFVYEILKTAYMMDAECYRLLIFRYIFAIAYGCYLVMADKTIRRIWYFAGGASELRT